MVTRRGKSLHSFQADIRRFQDRIMPATLVAFQKRIAFELYRRILEKTPVDKGFLRGAWTVSIGTTSDANEGSQTQAQNGQPPTAQELGHLESGINAMQDEQIGQIIWINNSMPYVFRIEFEGHSREKAPQGMVNLSLEEVQTWLRTQYGKLFEVGDIR